MLLPRFTLRAVLGIFTLAAFVFLVAGMAYRGQTWAWGVTIAVICAAITLLVHAAWFGVAWLFAQLPSTQAPPMPASEGSMYAVDSGPGSFLESNTETEIHQATGEEQATE